MSRALAGQFECAWESLGPVPQVRIDFGDGEVLETTLGGNVLTSFCLADGTVFDVLPGVTTADSYLVAAREAAKLARWIESRPEPMRLAALRDALQALPGVWPWVAHLAGGRPASEPGVRGPVDLEAAEPLPLVESAPSIPSLRAAFSKSVVEEPLVTAIQTVEVASVGDPLVEDARRVATILRPQARAVLASVPAPTPAEVTPHVFRLVLQIDLADRYLGLRGVLTGLERRR
ncbi:MAG: hypothetical protein AAGB93_19425 [Planctomycetota bacterium]